MRKSICYKSSKHHIRVYIFFFYMDLLYIRSLNQSKYRTFIHHFTHNLAKIDSSFYVLPFFPHCVCVSKFHSIIFLLRFFFLLRCYSFVFYQISNLFYLFFYLCSIQTTYNGLRNLNNF